VCGLAGIVGLRGGKADPRALHQMTSVMAHRGPDEEGSYIDGPVGFGFRRLSILDLSPSGHQPMQTPDGDVVLVFNGEIYNYIELRKELQDLGYRFKSTGDTEVLLYAYCAWGTECVSRLNGMWAFLIYDKKRRLVFGSRDRFGIKPLYHYHRADCMLFGSEIKAIRASGYYEGGTNWPIAASFLILQRLEHTNHSLYTDIEQLPPGSAFELQLDGAYRQWRFWSLAQVGGNTVEDPPSEFAALLEDAVSIHMRSDVPVAIHLSGGLDSTSILCASSRIRKMGGATKPLLAFSYMTDEYDESKYIQDTIVYTGAEHVRLMTTPSSLWDRLRKTLWYHDEPVHSMTALVGYELMGLTAARGIRVVLNGQGADETIGGYGNYFRDYWHGLLRSGNFVRAWNEIKAYTETQDGNPWSRYANQVRHFVQTELGQFSGYRRLARWKHRRSFLENSWFTPQLVGWLPDEELSVKAEGLEESLLDAITREPLPLYLRVEDRNAMAHSVEARLPFLDYRLVSLVARMSSDWKLRGPWNKFVLRESMRGRIPESVRSRVDKMGFPVPTRKWFIDSLYEPMIDLLNSRPARERGIYRIDKILHDIERHRRGEIDVSGRLFDVAQFELWCAAETPRELARSSLVSSIGEVKNTEAI
jgi:asparagine synthase (glutamine-hydrolysing)